MASKTKRGNTPIIVFKFEDMGGSQSTAKGNMASAQMSMAQQEVEALTDMYSR